MYLKHRENFMIIIKTKILYLTYANKSKVPIYEQIEHRDTFYIILLKIYPKKQLHFTEITQKKHTYSRVVM